MSSGGPLSAFAARWRSSRGITRSLETMMAMATDSTITMAVAAESPPTKASRAMVSKPAASGTAST